MNDADAKDRERNCSQICFPRRACVVSLSIHVERQIASFENVFSHQSDDRLVTVNMRLRQEQNRKASYRDDNQESDKECVAAYHGSMRDLGVVKWLVAAKQIFAPSQRLSHRLISAHSCQALCALGGFDCFWESIIFRQRGRERTQH